MPFDPLYQSKLYSDNYFCCSDDLLLLFLLNDLSVFITATIVRAVSKSSHKVKYDYRSSLGICTPKVRMCNISARLENYLIATVVKD